MEKYFYTLKQERNLFPQINNGKIRILPQTPSLADLTESRSVSSNIAQNNDLSTPQSMVQNGKTYGMTTVKFLKGRQPECALMTAFDLSELFVL